jgi:hypothetical protein
MGGWSAPSRGGGCVRLQGVDDGSVCRRTVASDSLIIVRLTGKNMKIKYSKLDMIEEHITAAIQMIATGCNPFSTHIVVKAAHELVEVIANKRGILLGWDPRIWIKDEHLGEYRALANKAYNYLKHADRDADKHYDGPDAHELATLNEILTVLNVNGYKMLGCHISPALIDFSWIVNIKHPQLFKKEFIDSLPAFKEQLQTVNRDPEIVRFVLRHRLLQHKLLPSD